MADMVDLVKVVILVQLFFSLGITLTSHAIPENALNYVTSFSDLGSDMSFDGISDKVQSSLQSQTNIPVIELGVLVFYSGNILLDFLLNFAFAIPELISLIINGLLMLFPFGEAVAFIPATIQIFSSVAIMAYYFIGLMQLITGIRSGRII